jgi:dihydroflavonol-4-reductase
VRRFLQTSTAGTCGPVPGRPATEEDAPPPWKLSVPYKRTKLEAERIVLAAAREGLDAVVVNPTTPVGEGDRSPTPTGRMIEGIASGCYRAYLATGLNIVDVRVWVPKTQVPCKSARSQTAIRVLARPDVRALAD